MQNLGIVKPGSTLRLNFDTFDGGTGAPITMTGFTTADIEIYKDDEFVTQRASDTGYALLDDGIDVDGITGVHAYSIDLSSNATAGFYACGSHYSVRIGPVTVDGQTVNFWHAEFTIGQPAAVWNTTIASITDQDTFVLTIGPAEADALNGCTVMIQDVASAVQFGFGVVTDYIVTSKTVQLLAGPTYTLAATDSISFFQPSNAHWFGQAIQGGDGVNLTETGGDGAQLTEAGGDGDHLTAINLPNQTMDITGSITGNLSGSVGSVTGAVGSVAGNVDGSTASVSGAVGSVAGNVDGSVGSNVELGPAEVNAEVVDVMRTDALTATAQAAPSTTPTIAAAIMTLYDALVHKVDVTATSKEFSNNAGTVIWKKALSDDATNYIEAESASGP